MKPVQHRAEPVGNPVANRHESRDSVSLFGTLRAIAKKHPESNALLAPGRLPVTYRQLIDHLTSVGRALAAQRISRSDCVATVLPNGPDMAASFVGIAAFATCAPLNPEYRRAELEYYLTDLRAKAIVVPDETDTLARSVAARLGLSIISLSPPSSPEATELAPWPDPGGSTHIPEYGRDDDVALVLHTSGTTSRPKQVPLSHRNLCASAQDIARVLQLSPDDRCLNVMPLFHVHGLIGVLLSSLRSGASVVCAPGYEDGSFGALMRDFGPTWYSAVPTIHQSVLSLVNHEPDISARGPLRLIRSSSASLSPLLTEDLESTFGVPVIEAYGMTEAAHQIASNPLPPAVRKPGSVGLPAGPEMAVMDESGGILPTGDVGEIVIRGSNVTTGYLKSPEANELAFSGDWFRTGDLGRMDDDGYFHLIGRTKEMINRGGETISPREIDEVLMEHPAVAQCVAFSVPHPGLGEDVAAAVVLQDDRAATEDDLRRFAFERLAPSKVPNRILTVATIPKGPTGKLQRIGLHEAFEDQLRSQHVEPRTDLEIDVVAAIEETLQAGSVGVTDNFFSLGGDSIQAGRVLTRLSAKYQVDLPAVSLFLNPSPRELSREITRLVGEDTSVLEELLADLEDSSDNEAS